MSFVGQGAYFDPTLNVDGVVAGAKGYMTDILTAHAVSFIAAAPADKPFPAFIPIRCVPSRRNRATRAHSPPT